jgi:hypothetical protein
VWLSLAVVALSACTDKAPAQGHPANATPSTPVHSDPLALVGQWFLDADGEAPGSAVAFGEQLTLFLSCGVLDGEWKADREQSLFVASSSGGDNGCFAGGAREPLPWLDAAVAFRVDGPNRRLLDRNGRTVALLRPGAKPTVGPNRSKSFYETPPTVTPAMTLAAQDPAALPADAAPIDTDQLAHDWIPNDLPPTSRARLTFGDAGRWTGSDGCNSLGSRFVLGREGRLLATVGGSTAIGCRGAPVGAWMAQVSRAGLVAGQLALYDRDGKALGRLHRADGPAGASATPSPEGGRPTAGKVERRLPLGARGELQVVAGAGLAPRLRLLDDVARPDVAGDVSPPGLGPDDDIRDLALRDGRWWAEVGNCAMGRTTTWTSTDNGRHWTGHDGPSYAHCSAGSATTLLLLGRDRATAYVTVGALQETTRWTTTDGGRTWAQAALTSGRWKAVGTTPAAGVCGAGNGFLATLETNPDTPLPRCLVVSPRERLRVVNTSARFGQKGQDVTVTFAGFAPRRLGSGEATIFETPVGAYLEPGVHDLHISLYRGSGGGEVWLKP